MVNGQLKVIGVWESKADADRFFAETLGPTLARELGPRAMTFRAQPPPVVGIEVGHSYQRP
jgi:hypothetical protein